MPDVEINLEDFYKLANGEGDFENVSEEDFIYFMNQENDRTVLSQCVSGVADSLFSQLSPLILAVLFSRIVKITGLPSLLKHALISVLGILAIFNSVHDQNLLSTVIIITFSLILVTRITPRHRRGVVVTVVGISVILVVELLFDNATVIRGLLMVLVMKISSLAFDAVEPALSSTVTFLLDPATVVFGPFVSYSEYELSVRRRSLKGEILGWIGGCFWLLLGGGCAVYSSCQNVMFSIDGLGKEYLTAQSFRFSHYFVCLFSQGLWLISGGSAVVTNPIPVEIPRSLVDVVVVWNVPMHRYLRKYVFQRAKMLNSAFAIFITFAVSSLLHGLNAQLSSVLFSLGLLCYGESVLRDRISRKFSTCVRARSCTNCEHKRKKNSLLSLSLNLIFSLLAIYHLIYLGMPFDGHSSASHAFSVWHRHHFASHAIAIGYLILARLL